MWAFILAQCAFDSCLPEDRDWSFGFGPIGREFYGTGEGGPQDARCAVVPWPYRILWPALPRPAISRKSG